MVIFIIFKQTLTVPLPILVDLPRALKCSQEDKLNGNVFKNFVFKKLHNSKKLMQQKLHADKTKLFIKALVMS